MTRPVAPGNRPCRHADLPVRETADSTLSLHGGRAAAEGGTDPLAFADETRRTAYGAQPSA